MISSITTVFGPAPPVLNLGAGAELYRGLGAGALFGLLFSTLITPAFLSALPSLALQARDPLGARRTAAVS